MTLRNLMTPKLSVSFSKIEFPYLCVVNEWTQCLVTCLDLEHPSISCNLLQFQEFHLFAPWMVHIVGHARNSSSPRSKNIAKAENITTNSSTLSMAKKSKLLKFRHRKRFKLKLLSNTIPKNPEEERNGKMKMRLRKKMIRETGNGKRKMSVLHVMKYKHFFPHYFWDNFQTLWFISK